MSRCTPTPATRRTSSGTFYTAPADGRLIIDGSVQAQLLRRRHDGDVDRLDAERSDVLATVAPESRKLRADKPLGRLDRYPLGTVAVLVELSVLGEVHLLLEPVARTGRGAPRPTRARLRRSAPR
ncbi:DUF6430 domain-containing protein [Kitasatospora purpeofusca]|uniref:macro domain-containing protein n=1 Tax=Kitasatospora purpeofusca TaxID=67352 RepID=UPI00225BCCF0|nr:macro domain-containing protein [Kitasatospora purpeofusca]MCX4683908.1 DUF6430 domain-containing protein [Kitasatospora purpeofusca]